IDLTPLAAAAFSIAAAEPESMGAMIRTFAPSATHWSACDFCFCGSPCALTTLAATPAALKDLSRYGLSNCSQRTDVFVSGINPQARMPACGFAVPALATVSATTAVPATASATVDLRTNLFTCESPSYIC